MFLTITGIYMYLLLCKTLLASIHCISCNLFFHVIKTPVSYVGQAALWDLKLVFLKFCPAPGVRTIPSNRSSFQFDYPRAAATIENNEDSRICLPTIP